MCSLSGPDGMSKSIHSFVHSLIHSTIHAIVRCLLVLSVRSGWNEYIHSFIHSFVVFLFSLSGPDGMSTVIHLFIHLFICSLVLSVRSGWNEYSPFIARIRSHSRQRKALRENYGNERSRGNLSELETGFFLLLYMRLSPSPLFSSATGPPPLLSSPKETRHLLPRISWLLEKLETFKKKTYQSTLKYLQNESDLVTVS